MTTTKTIKSIKADYAAKIRALRAERDEAVSEARAARAEKRAQVLSMPMLNDSVAVSETIAERAKRVYSEVEELCAELSAKEEAGTKAAVEQLRSIHGDDLVDEAVAEHCYLFDGVRYIGYTEEDAIAESYVSAILSSSYTHVIPAFGEYQPKLNMEENRKVMESDEPLIFGWETEALNNYLIHYFDEWE
ncbi:hypothetical protein J9S84_004605 [Salmonella enterica]|uniref:hypothetical protein n=1 Tax=Salmonella enterica TaxID=28901 RepID=UPI000973D0B7|nr:hypothetical protein [Salmonella enterica]EBE2904041.1 hypothetical protein [Salmonella enterica subsp. enterica serovar Krefeld]EDQ2558364.1 hypothetical protein [Salmonella enterica subsp. enterica serovar Langensalza]EDT5367957.1 hypothetical protein [Salmonella enterica subsp. enterica]APY72360.1 hypothetical protein LFZ24_08430 [Salmonella enterica subsp. enterica serovar Krefeld str. SA20030536]EAY9603190.1 hypothetical protein [Salmonella enterica]